MDALQAKLSAELDAVERDAIRPKQKAALQCSVQCCDDHTKDAAPALNACFERCTSTLLNAQSITQQHLADFENRIQRCIARCEDTAMANLRATGASPQSQNDPAVQEAQKLMDHCLNDCVNEFQGEIVSLGKAIRTQIKTLK